MSRPDSAFVVLRRHARILLVYSREDRRWQLPGGRIEEGETARSAARRECREETGLSPRLIRLTGVYDRRDGTRAHVFVGCPAGPCVLRGPTPEIREQRWVTPASAMRLLRRRHGRRLQDALRPAFAPARRALSARG